MMQKGYWKNYTVPCRPSYWMRGHGNSRGLFAAMRVAVQLQQANAFKEHRSI
jgi:hypothetical protein